MTSFRKYMAYRVQSTLLRTLIIAVMALLLTASLCDARYIVYETGMYGATSHVWYSFGVLPFLLVVLSLLIPALELSGLKNRRNLDTLLTLPVSRGKMALAHMLNGLWQLLVIYSLCFGYVVIMGLGIQEHVRLSYMLPYYLFSVLAGIALYAFCLFFFMQANTVGDGIAFELMSIMLLNAILDPLSKIYNALPIPTTLGFSYMPLVVIHEKYSYSVIHNATRLTSAAETITCIVWAVLGLLALLGYFLTFIKKKTETIGGISDSFFGYRVMLPIYGLSYGYIGFLGLGGQSLALISTVIGYVIYRRGFRFKPSDYVVMVLTAACAIAFSF